MYTSGHLHLIGIYLRLTYAKIYTTEGLTNEKKKKIYEVKLHVNFFFKAHAEQLNKCKINEICVNHVSKQDMCTACENM